MQRILYIDCIFLENLVMDLFLVALTARTLKKPATFFGCWAAVCWEREDIAWFCVLRGFRIRLRYCLE